MYLNNPKRRQRLTKGFSDLRVLKKWGGGETLWNLIDVFDVWEVWE